MLRKESFTKEWNISEPGNARHTALRERLSLERFADKGRESRAEKRQCKASGILVGMHAERKKRKEESEQNTDARAGEEPERKGTRRKRDGKTSNRTHEHDALNAEIENTRLLMNHDACRRDKERRAGI